AAYRGGMNPHRLVASTRLPIGFGLGALLCAAACSSDDSSTSAGGTSSGGAGTTASSMSTGPGPGTGGASGGMTSSSGMGGMMATSSTGTGGMGGGPPPDFDCTAASGTIPNLVLTLLSDQLNEPLQLKSAPDDPDRLYVLQKSGEIRIIENNNLLPTPFL